ncbi:biotin transporter BioY [Alkaliphilus serpentinus]|uniref:Biotin transporter n=1 Tax=Alkaliphilus serpentinus TaxID=1482731 RepID=A0A833HMG5_9FIRM|nr:biotin transporter BioY [Alkaliphilus serpentinus]KAB3527659.1 biotin transporter BioY [Alkaliphilus serpentinus]
MFKNLSLRDITYSAVFAALICILSYVYLPIPFSTVPITGQTLGIMLAGSLLKTRQAVLSVLIFLIIGFIGIPVFAGGASGISVLMGPTGGYLIGFLIGVMVIGLLKGSKNQLVRITAANIIGGIIVVYVLGVSWLSYSTGMDLKSAFVAGALYFLIGDIVKVAIASTLAVTLNKQLKKILTN